MCKVTTNSQTDQTFPALFEAGSIDKTKIRLDFDAPDITSVGGLLLAKATESRSSRQDVGQTTECSKPIEAKQQAQSP